ncbi:TPA: lipocalin family protein [Photobacterium damselae]
MKKILMIIVMMITSSLSLANNKHDITEFDYPFLLGDWYWFSPSDDGVESDGVHYRAMNIKFKSTYQFMLRMLKADGSVDEWVGTYDIDESSVTLFANGHPEQSHSYMLSYNQFILDGARFTKLAPENLPGNWRSSQLSGKDIHQEIEELSLSLRPDFLFSAEVSDKEGKTKQHQGVYYLEDNNIVLMYETGQHSSEFQLASDTLTLTNTDFGMEAVMLRE